MGELEISLDKNWTDPIHDQSSVTFGNGGWSVSSSTDAMIGCFNTATDHLGSAGMEAKIEILYKFLNYAGSKLSNTFNKEYLNFDNRQFLDYFEIENPGLIFIYQSGDSPQSKNREMKEIDGWQKTQLQSLTMYLNNY